jgi:hypothetical protein
MRKPRLWWRAMTWAHKIGALYSHVKIKRLLWDQRSEGWNCICAFDLSQELKCEVRSEVHICENSRNANLAQYPKARAFSSYSCNYDMIPERHQYGMQRQRYACNMLYEAAPSPCLTTSFLSSFSIFLLRSARSSGLITLASPSSPTCLPLSMPEEDASA